MKWIGQHIQSLISRFRNDVYLEDISSGTIASGGNLGLDSNNKIVKAVEASGDITSVVAGDNLDGGGTSGDVTLGLNASTANAIDANTAKSTNVTTNLTATTAVDSIRINSSDGTNVIVAEASGSIAGIMTVAHHDKLDGIEASATADQGKSDIDGLAITTVGTIDTGVWNGTAIATDQQKHLMHYQLAGYSTGNGTNYEMAQNVHDTNAPFEHNTSIGADGTTAVSVATMIRSGGHVMPKACTLTRWTGWATTVGSQTAYVALFKVTPTRNDNTNLSAVLLDEFSYTALGNQKAEDWDETSFTASAVAAGDILITAMKCQSGYVQYFNSTVEVEF